MDSGARWGVQSGRVERRSGAGGAPVGGPRVSVTPASAAGSAGEMERLRQLRALSLGLAQACTVEALVDVLSIRVALDCGAETSVVYLMDPDQPDVLRLAAARAVAGAAIDPSLLCGDGGALIARAVRRQQPQLSLEHD